MPTGEHALDRWCSARGIEHRLIPVGQKELNGKVENTHKHDDREFYAKYSFKNFEDLAKAMKGYNGRWNEIRATKALGWKTPWGAIEWSYVRMLACLMMLQRPPKAELPVSVNKAKPKKLSTTGRYLQWLNWDEAQRKQTKALFYLPQISQNFSAYLRVFSGVWPTIEKFVSIYRFPRCRRNVGGKYFAHTRARS